MSDSLKFSIQCGALSGAAIVFVAVIGQNSLMVLLAMAAAAIFTADLIGKRKVADFKIRFRLAFGATAIAAMCFLGLLMYLRGKSGPVWLHLLNIPIWLMAAGLVAALIAAATGPTRPTFDPA